MIILIKTFKVKCLKSSNILIISRPASIQVLSIDGSHFGDWILMHLEYQIYIGKRIGSFFTAEINRLLAKTAAQNHLTKIGNLGFNVYVSLHNWFKSGWLICRTHLYRFQMAYTSCYQRKHHSLRRRDKKAKRGFGAKTLFIIRC